MIMILNFYFENNTSNVIINQKTFHSRHLSLFPTCNY
jgi:hypothetical protein